MRAAALRAICCFTPMVEREMMMMMSALLRDGDTLRLRRASDY